MRYVRSVAVQQVDGYDIQELTDLGFWSDAAALLHVTDGPSNRVGSQDRSFIHRCLEKRALLSRPFTKHRIVNVVEIIQEEDFQG